MHITVFGATGRTGIPLVRQALDRGHDVIAFVRSPEKLPIDSDALTVIQGDVYTGNGVVDSIDGADAVISVLGHTGDGPDDLMTVAAENIVEAMRKEGVSRFVTVVGGSVGEPKDQMSLVLRVQRFLLEKFAGEVLTDQERHVSAIRETNLEWTVVRAPWLTGGDGKGEYRAGNVNLGLGWIARPDLAHFLLDCVEHEQYIRESPKVRRA